MSKYMVSYPRRPESSKQPYGNLKALQVPRKCPLSSWSRSTRRTKDKMTEITKF
jgi:hypothetical protein